MERGTSTQKVFYFFLLPTQGLFKNRLFFMFNIDRHRVLKCDIGVKDISDHAGVYLTLNLKNKPKETLWRLNTVS